MKPMTVSADLAAVVGNGPMPRSEVVKGLWSISRRTISRIPRISATSMLSGPTEVFDGKAVVNMFEMTKLVSIASLLIATLKRSTSQFLTLIALKNGLLYN